MLRWLLLVLGVIAAAIALAPLAPLGPLRPEIEARLSELFNREVEIGSMRLSLLGGPYLVMNFTATATLSPEATERVKSASLLPDAITTWLEKGNRLTIPVSFAGGVRDPKVRVDVGRLF